jgi:hypothetical protein
MQQMLKNKKKSTHRFQQIEILLSRRKLIFQLQRLISELVPSPLELIELIVDIWFGVRIRNVAVSVRVDESFDSFVQELRETRN